MSEILNRFSLHAAKFHGQVWVCLATIWLIVLFCTISSILAQPISARQKKFWILTVCLAPVLGTLAYLPFACRWDYLAHLFFFRMNGKQKTNSESKTGRFDGKQVP